MHYICMTLYVCACYFVMILCTIIFFSFCNYSMATYVYLHVPFICQGSEADFQQLSDRYVKMKNKLEKLATEKDIMSTSSTKAEIHLVEDVETVLSKLINTWKLVVSPVLHACTGIPSFYGIICTLIKAPPSHVALL